MNRKHSRICTYLIDISSIQNVDRLFLNEDAINLFERLYSVVDQMRQTSQWDVLQADSKSQLLFLLDVPCSLQFHGGPVLLRSLRRNCRLGRQKVINQIMAQGSIFALSHYLILIRLLLSRIYFPSDIYVYTLVTQPLTNLIFSQNPTAESLL